MPPPGSQCGDADDSRAADGAHRRPEGVRGLPQDRHKTADEIKDLASKAARSRGIVRFGHTRHVFSVAEARQPQACQTCHMGFDHPQWEMYSTSKHGVRYMLKQTRAVPATVVGPSCQTVTCQTATTSADGVGFPGREDAAAADRQWAADRTLILEALGILDPDGRPTARLGAVKAADMARFTEESWQRNATR